MKLFQSLIYQIKDTIDYEFGITDEAGLILACSDDKAVGTQDPMVLEVLEDKEPSVVINGITYLKIFIKGKLEFVTYIKTDREEGLKYLTLISVNIVNIKQYHEDKFDKNNFIKNVILDNILPSDISVRSKELHIAYNSFRVVFLIKTEKEKEAMVTEILLSLFPNRAKDFVIGLDEENTVLVKELKGDDDLKEIDRTAKIIIDTLNTELMIKAYIGIGTIVDRLRDLGRSFKEAQTALTVGGIFENDKHIINYNNLGIGRLIYQLPTTLCKLFLKEVFDEGSLESLDAETLLTIQKFFENNLNVSETSRQLYVHRNTLVYRLDKIQKITGLDLRKFDDAIIFKVSMLVKKYLDKGESLI